ncbi:hypothetical protein LR48_Vigan08g064700 [Vigna angularis]|uniref:Putative plant transposon protein domain-containing protein n=1 Tax=Phaseolus angularis TaxID=3914 RepID=A0A0L9V429_PHAAN|nr:hypothetical protein LR48_Vigan08g064700 [Vigna angularis]
MHSSPGKPVKYKNRLWVVKEIKVNKVIEIKAPYSRGVKKVDSKLPKINITTHRVVFIYCVLKGLNINVGRVIANEIKQCTHAASNKYPLGHPSLITCLCELADKRHALESMMEALYRGEQVSGGAGASGATAMEDDDDDEDEEDDREEDEEEERMKKLMKTQMIAEDDESDDNIY